MPKDTADMTDAEMDAEIAELLLDPVFQEDPSYIARVRLAYENRTTYPYAEGKGDLAEYIRLHDGNWQGNAELVRFGELSRKLIKHGISPDDIAEHAKRLVEEREHGPRAAEVVEISHRRAMEALSDDEGN